MLGWLGLGSAAVNNAFFEDLSDVLERMATYACPILLLGDVNIHLDIVDDPNTVKWCSVLGSHGLVQHITSPIHRAGHTLDVVVTRSECTVSNVRVQSPSLSDHAFITVDVDLKVNAGQSATVIRRRQWRSFDFDAFCDSLRQSTLLTDPPGDCASLVDCYNTTLQSLLDQHAPFVIVKPRAHANAPWYNRECQTAKAAARRLEHIYRCVERPGDSNSTCFATRSAKHTSVTGPRRLPLMPTTLERSGRSSTFY